MCLRRASTPPTAGTPGGRHQIVQCELGPTTLSRAQVQHGSRASLLGVDPESIKFNHLKADTRITTTIYATMKSHLDVLPAFYDAEAVHCPDTAEHSTRVGSMCAAMSRELGLEQLDVEVMHWVGILHDLGKLAVSAEVLRKPGPLTEVEWAEVEKHSVVGSNLILAISPELGPLAAAIRAHHERWDGSGYPDRTDGFDIPLFGRIAAVADVFDAITHWRGYRSGRLTHPEGVEFVIERANRDFDPEVVSVFVSLDRRGLIGSSGDDMGSPL